MALPQNTLLLAGLATCPKVHIPVFTVANCCRNGSETRYESINSTAIHNSHRRQLMFFDDWRDAHDSGSISWLLGHDYNVCIGPGVEEGANQPTDQHKLTSLR
jgi:hypothetical protein